METQEKQIASEVKTEEFNFNKHFVNALLASLYYLFIFIPFILPFKVWEKAATRISLLWETKSIGYKEGESGYPLFNFYFRYIISFFFDATIFLAWLLGLVFQIVTYQKFMLFLGGLFAVYVSVVFIRLAKEIWFYIINNLITWLLEVFTNIGKLIKNMWLLNIVVKNKKLN